MPKFYIILAISLLTASVNAQSLPQGKYLNIGLSADYTLINDQTIGELPLKGNGTGLSISYTVSREKHIWSVGLNGGIGFLNTFNYPSIEDRIANRYFGKISGEYLHRVSSNQNKLKIFIGGEMSIQVQANQILPFSNSQANYFGHIGIAPKIHLRYPIRRFSFFAQAATDLAAVVFRPSYSVPFRDDKIENIKLQWLGSYGSVRSDLGVCYNMKNKNAISLAYSWQYDWSNHQNTVKQAIHGLTLMMHVNL